MTNTERCPKCGGECEHDEVDIGVGIQQGPPYCIECGWTPKSLLDWEDDCREAQDNTPSKGPFDK